MYSSFGVHELMRDIVKGRHILDSGSIQFRLYDGDSTDAAALLFDSAPLDAPGRSEGGLLHARQQAAFNGQTWTPVFDQVPGSTIGSVQSQTEALRIFVADTLISILLCLLLVAYLNTRRQAQAVARQIEQTALERDQVSILQNAIFNSANFFGIATGALGVMQIFKVGAERTLGSSAFKVRL